MELRVLRYFIEVAREGSITSGDTRVVVNDLEQGLSDFAVIVEPPDLSKYNYLFSAPLRKYKALKCLSALKASMQLPLCIYA